MKNTKLYEQIKNYIPYNEKEKEDRLVMLDFLEKNDNALVRDNKIAHFTTSAWIVNKTRDKVLMIHHNIYNSWAWVGGHADGIEDLFEVIKREIEEETGLSIKDCKPLSNEIFGLSIGTVEAHIKREKQVSAHLHLDVEYLFECDENIPLVAKEDENSGVAWIPIEEINAKVREEKMLPVYFSLIDRAERFWY